MRLDHIALSAGDYLLRNDRRASRNVAAMVRRFANSPMFQSQCSTMAATNRLTRLQLMSNYFQMAYMFGFLKYVETTLSCSDKRTRLESAILLTARSRCVATYSRLGRTPRTLSVRRFRFSLGHTNPDPVERAEVDATYGITRSNGDLKLSDRCPPPQIHLITEKRGSATADRTPKD